MPSPTSLRRAFACTSVPCRFVRLRLLQDTTRRTLTDRHGAWFWFNRRDPMRLFVDRPYLDDAIARLFGGATA
jgi:hypothetical protein